MSFTAAVAKKRLEWPAIQDLDHRGSAPMAASGGASSSCVEIPSRILILNCDRTYSDIREMTECIVAKETRNGNICTVIDSLETTDSLTENFDKLIITSHHCFYTKDEFVSVKPLKSRQLGDYNLRSVADTICNLVKNHKVFDVQFYSCEFALSETTRHMKRRCELLSKSFSEPDFDQVIDSCEKREDFKVSSLEYVTSYVYHALKKTYNYKEVKLRGLTGVGYIGVDVIPKSFDRDHYGEYLNILKLEKSLPKLLNPKVAKQLADEIRSRKSAFEAHVEDFDSPHQIELVINPKDESAS